MPLQNRVDPFSRIHSVPTRCQFMGNRGRLHDADSKTLIKQTWATNTWIICLCDFKDRHRNVMGRNSYTELFFLDEVTALAAGHRPCFECRRQAAKNFSRAVQISLERQKPLKVDELSDLILRDIKPYIRSFNPSARDIINPRDLPDGAMYAIGDTAFLKQDQSALSWSFEGYGVREPLPSSASMLTPRITCKALFAGYQPQYHPSATN